jgi:hypothetical protein
MGTDTTPYVDRTCADASTLPIPEAEFLTLYEEKLCFAYQSCNPSIDCQQIVSDLSPCDYVDTEACSCLDTTFICDDSLGAGFEFIASDEACEPVFDCAT